ncbi:hypothetical protein K3495_g5656 [Podosphaera aphanis]|nr:hypothetical protein K3495_g5656 [Podosphaera aphanis]
MPAVETVTIINKSGKIVSTGKQLVNIFREAKAAYQEKRDELKAEHYARIRARNKERLRQARIENGSVATSRRSHHSKRSERHSRKHDDQASTRPPLTAENLSYVTESTEISSSTCSLTERRHSESHTVRDLPPRESTELPRPYIPRRHTAGPADSYLSGLASTLPPPYTSQIVRSVSNPDLSADSDIDMNLAYGSLPPDLRADDTEDPVKEEELETTLGKLDELLLEAHCLQHSATAIISNLQANPEAMAAVALTLAELSTILSKMGPSVLSAIKVASPGVFALLASPQFLIAGGLAMGVTVVMFGGFQIIKRMNTNAEIKREETSMQIAMAYDDIEMGSIKSWRRGVADAEAESIGTSVDGEFITPVAARLRNELNRERRGEIAYDDCISVDSGHSHKTIKQSDIPAPKIQLAPSEAGSRRSHRSVRQKGAAPSEAGSRRSHKETAPSEAGSQRSHKETAPSEAGSRRSHKEAPPSEAGSRRSHRSTMQKERADTSSHKAPSEAGSRRSHRSTKYYEVVVSSSQKAPSEAGSRRSHKSTKRKDEDTPSEAGSQRSRKSTKSRSHGSVYEGGKDDKKSTLSALSTIFEHRKEKSVLSLRPKSVNLIDI